jgi:hypothetical protein
MEQHENRDTEQRSRREATFDDCEPSAQTFPSAARSGQPFTAY